VANPDIPLDGAHHVMNTDIRLGGVTSLISFPVSHSRLFLHWRRKVLLFIEAITQSKWNMKTKISKITLDKYNYNTNHLSSAFSFRPRIVGLNN